MRMVRKQVYIESEQEHFLKRRADELGLTESELIRRSIDQLARIPVGIPWDPRAWEEELSFMRERASLVSARHPRSWSRDDLYEERLGRLSR